MGAIVLCLLGVLTSVAHAQNNYSLEMAAIRFIESSDGRNLNHQMLTSGMHQGTRAGGAYGIMPITARETIVKNRVLNSQYGQYASFTNDQITSELNDNKKLDVVLATFMWAKLRKKYSAERAACSWFRGEHAELCQDEMALSSDPYVAKFKNALGEIKHTVAKR